MPRFFIAALVAVSTTVTAFSAAPAAASNDDVAKALGAAATLYILGKAIEKSRDDDDKKKKKIVVHKDFKNHNFKTHKGHKHHSKHGNKHFSKPVIKHDRGLPQVVQRNAHKPHNRLAALPQRCVRQITGGHVRRVVMDRCLDRHFGAATALPRACKMHVATHRGARLAYALPCLRNRGYTIARH